MAPWPPISRDDLKHAATSAGFDTLFPILIRRLIAETAQGLTELEMPGGSGTATGGFDGVVSTAAEAVFIPGGTSVWELSVQGTAQAKADDDYVKRLAGPNGEDPSTVTYVQAILAPWTKARTWANDRMKEGRWKEVRAYNLDSIHTWLDMAPATMAWLASHLGKALAGVRSVDHWWNETWLPSTRIPLSSTVVLAGRKDVAGRFVDLLLRSSKSVITASGHLRADELRAVVAASVHQAEGPDFQQLLARTLFITDSTSLAQLLGQGKPLILVLINPDLVNDIPLRHAHKIVLVAHVGATPDLEVLPLDGQVVAEELKHIEASHDRLSFYATLARRSLLALRRALAADPAVLRPSWAVAPGIVTRRIALIEAWDGTNLKDRQIIEQLVGMSYTEIREASLGLMGTPEEPFLDRLDERWHVVSPEDSWTLLNGYLTYDDMHGFETCCMETLTEWSSSDERHGDAQSDNRVGSSSRALREGVSCTLALLSDQHTLVQTPGGFSGIEWSRKIVRRVLSWANADESYSRWTTLDDVIPLLAEAAPAEFIDAIRFGLNGNPPLHASMFQDGGPKGSFPPRSPHISFMSALSVMAWLPAYFDDVVDIMAKLAAIDPGGYWSGRPSDKLKEMFSIWYSNTSASSEQKFRALERILRRQPEIGRPLVVDLIPSGHETQLSTPGPKFHDWRIARRVTRTEYDKSLVALVDLAMGNLDNDPECYLALIAKIDRLTNAQRRIFAERIRTLSESHIDDQMRSRIFNAIRDKVARHRTYSGTNWALPEGELSVLEESAIVIRPHSEVARTSWLFKSPWISLGNPLEHEDHRRYDAIVSLKRREVVIRLMVVGGLPMVIELATTTEYQRLVGGTLGECFSDVGNQLLTWLDRDQSVYFEVAAGYFEKRILREGETLLDRMVANADASGVKATLLNLCYDRPAVWRRLMDLPPDVSRLYWSKFRYFGLGDNFGQVEQAAKGMMGVSRFAATLDLIALYARNAGSLDIAEIAARAVEGMLNGDSADAEISLLSVHDFEVIFRLLAEHRVSLGVQRVANLEWNLLPIGTFDEEAPTLHTVLAEDASFFAELVGYVYKRDDVELDGADVVPENERRVARRAFEVLGSWRKCPGIGADGTLESELLSTWISVARSELNDRGVLRSGDGEIGRVLAFAPSDSDGHFPPLIVRDLLEEMQNDEMDAGLEIGIFNKRGVTTRGVFDGGVQELDLSNKFSADAERSSEWPRTRKILAQLAQTYESDARSEDSEAERRRRGL
ncbi:MAG TPA: hypothetical protein VFX16_16905 [Pseudonocardiaceae bacterium]|nr:hypothetical protein [Pseudonocardiaceae bacterium]